MDMLAQFDRIEPVVLAHQVMHARIPGGIRRLSFDTYPGCDDPYPFDWRNVRHYACAVAAAAAECAPQVTFGWMHNGAIFVAVAATRYGLKGAVAGSVLGPISEHYRFQGLRPSWYERLLFAFTFRRLNRLVVPSKGTGLDLERHFAAPTARVQCIYNGIDQARIAALSATPLPDDAPRGRYVLAVSRLSLEKGFDIQLQAFAHLRHHSDLSLVILGEGPMRTMIEAEIRRLDLVGRVHLRGFEENPFRWMRHAEAFLMASRLEGFGNALVEAMALGLPVVSTACPHGPREIVEDGVSGLLVPVDDALALAQRLDAILQDQSLAERLSQGARQRARIFSIEIMMQHYQELLIELVER
jgi:glycosyltransferase involved in cell wall biosynthesis